MGERLQWDTFARCVGHEDHFPEEVQTHMSSKIS